MTDDIDFLSRTFEAGAILGGVVFIFSKLILGSSTREALVNAGASASVAIITTAIDEESKSKYKSFGKPKDKWRELDY